MFVFRMNDLFIQDKLWYLNRNKEVLLLDLREAIKKKIGKILEFFQKGGGVSAKIKKV